MSDKIKGLIILFLSSAFLIFVMGQGCTKIEGNQHVDGQSALNDTPPDQLKIIPNTKTMSMTYARQIMDSMVSCTGIQQAGNDVKSIFSEREGSLSEFGYALEVSSPMLMAATSLAGEVCYQLIQEEMGAQQKRIFPQVDFSRSPASLTDRQIGDSARRLARSCWLRNETADERKLLIEGLRDAIDDDTETKDAMLFMCTVMLGSLSGLEM